MAGLTRLNRRDFLRIGGTGVAGVIAGQAWPYTPAWAAEGAKAPAYPVTDIGPLAAVPQGAAIEFNYPDAESPAVMIRLAEGAKDGIGPGNAVVAYSTLCTHKGCSVAFHPEHKLLICPCHWSTFDPAKAGGIVIGQASQPLPQIELRVAGGNVQAVGVKGLIYGRHTNII